jgi:hypothetical protein
MGINSDFLGIAFCAVAGRHLSHGCTSYLRAHHDIWRGAAADEEQLACMRLCVCGLLCQAVLAGRAGATRWANAAVLCLTCAAVQSP